MVCNRRKEETVSSRNKKAVSSSGATPGLRVSKNRYRLSRGVLLAGFMLLLADHANAQATSTNVHCLGNHKFDDPNNKTYTIVTVRNFSPTTSLKVNSISIYSWKGPLLRQFIYLYGFPTGFEGDIRPNGSTSFHTGQGEVLGTLTPWGHLNIVVSVTQNGGGSRTFRVTATELVLSNSNITLSRDTTDCLSG
jgi:hypothetical protein